MSVLKFKAGVVLPVLVVGAVAGVAFLPIIRDRANKDKSTGTNAAAPSTSGSSPLPKTDSQAAYITADDFKYILPTGWSEVNLSTLQTAGAVSGIYTNSLPITQFRVAVEPSATSPKDLDTFKSTVLETINRYENFNMLSEGAIKVSGQDGYRYTYKLGSDNMAEQEFVIVLYKDKAFSLLFTGPESNFKTQSSTYDAIIASFQLL